MLPRGPIAVLALLLIAVPIAGAGSIWGGAYDGSGWSGVELFRFDAGTGNVQWQRSYAPSNFGYFIGDIAQTPNGNLYVTGYDSRFYRLDPTTGDIMNSWDLGGMYNALVAAGNSTLYFLDNTNGSSNRGYLGTISLDDSGNFAGEAYIGFADNLPDSDLEWYNGELLGTFWDSELHAIDPSDASITSTATTDIDYIAGMAWDQSTLYAASWYRGTGVYDLDPLSGSMSLQYDLGDQLNSTMTGITGMSSAIPEPSTFLLLGAGIVGAGIYVRRRKNA